MTGSISAPGLFEAATFGIPKEHPLRALYLFEPSGDAAAPAIGPAINVTVMHGVRASLALQRTHDEQAALAASNPEVAPHLSFMDAGDHGYAVVRATADALEVDFVAIPRPIERTDAPDGGPLAYRVAHRVTFWERGGTPRLERTTADGRLPLVL